MSESTGSFDAGSMDYGRDIKSMEQAMNKIGELLNGVLAIADTKSEQFLAIERAKQMCWVGVDGDEYIQRLKKETDEVRKLIDEVQAEFNEVFREDARAYQAFQQSNINNIVGK